MKKLLLTCAFVALLPFTANAQSDIIGGPDGAQTIHHCGWLPAAPGHYTETSLETGIVEQKLSQLGYLSFPGNGYYTRIDKAAVRAFQADEGIEVDGIVGPVTAQRLAYATHPSTNVHRCYHAAAGF